MFLNEPPRSPWDVNLALFRIPVRITPYFWLFALVFSVSGARSPWQMLGIVAAMLVSLLIHEMGHALAFRSFGYYPMITLYAMGGLTSTGPGTAYGARNPGPSGRLFITAAGPGVQLLVVAGIVTALMATGNRVVFLRSLLNVAPQVIQPVVSPSFTYFFLNPFLYFSVFWAILNLLPVYPLDGGQIARELLVRWNPWNGIRWSLMISVVVGALIAVLGVHQQQWFMTLVFGSLAYSSYMQLTSHGGGTW